MGWKSLVDSVLFDIELFSMKKYLLAKHWHYFIAAFVLPLSILVIGVTLPFSFLNGAAFFIALPLSILVAQMVVYFWLWNIGKVLLKNLPLYISNEYAFFKWLIIIPTIISLLIFAFLMVGASIVGMGYYTFSQTLISSMIIILPLWIALLISNIYCFYIAAKALKSSELGHNLRGIEFIGDFLLFIFFPIGIWFIQPRLNRLMLQMEEE